MANEVSGVGEIDGIRLRLEAVAGLADLLEVAWDAFSLTLAVCRECESQSAELFAAFAVAASAAASGRRALVAAPSLPPGVGNGAGREASVWPDLAETGDRLAGLAHVLCGVLFSAGSRARDPADRRACRDAATGAAQIRGLLARGTR